MGDPHSRILESTSKTSFTSLGIGLTFANPRAEKRDQHARDCKQKQPDPCVETALPQLPERRHEEIPSDENADDGGEHAGAGSSIPCGDKDRNDEYDKWKLAPKPRLQQPTQGCSDQNQDESKEIAGWIPSALSCAHTTDLCGRLPGETARPTLPVDIRVILTDGNYSVRNAS